ncbi:MAG: copper-binding protein [Alphaproteobacteria bacterium]
MKITLSAALLATMLYFTPGITPVLAHGGEAHNKPDASATVPQNAEGDGIIKAIDEDKSAITLQHGPIAALNWPPMTMTFKVESADVLKDAEIGNRVHFALKNEGGKPVVVKLQVKNY